MRRNRHIRLILIGCGSGFLISILALILGLRPSSLLTLSIFNAMAGTLAAYSAADYCKREKFDSENIQ